MSPRALPWLVPALLLAACGDDGGSTTTTDARPADTAEFDAAATGCDYTEQADLTNDDVFGGGTPEATGLSITSRAIVCGVFDHTHHDGDITADIDGYTFSVAADTDVLVRIDGAGAAAIEYAGVDIYGGAGLDQLAGTLTYYGNHGATAVHLTAGTYELAAFALTSTPLTVSVAYRLEVVTDNPDSRCPEVTAGGYGEANDGSNNDGNDVIQLPVGAPPALTASTTDAAEPTGIVLAASQNIRITGSAADIAAPDQYEDKDTYLLSTALGADEATIRLTWSSTATNLDFLLFEKNSAVPVMRANSAAMAGPEIETFSVKPSTEYWLLIGAKAGSTLPEAYTATLCGAKYAPL